MSVELICELATAHGGDVQLAEDMVAAAADAGAHTVKIQSYTLARLNPNDPQADWLRQSHLDERAHVRLMRACERHRVQFLSTPFDADALNMLKVLGLTRFKIASSEAASQWWRPSDDSGYRFVVSWPWGKPGEGGPYVSAHLVTIPLYPTPLECVSTLGWIMDGYSDHCQGIDAARYMVAKGAKILEVHMCLPGRSREMPFDKTPSQVGLLRHWIDACETMTSGMSTQFRTRWSA